MAVSKVIMKRFETLKFMKLMIKIELKFLRHPNQGKKMGNLSVKRRVRRLSKKLTLPCFEVPMCNAMIGINMYVFGLV